MNDKNQSLVIMDEVEARIAWGAIRKLLLERKWDLSDDTDWCRLLNTRNLEEKLRNYIEFGKCEDIVQR